LSKLKAVPKVLHLAFLTPIVSHFAVIRSGIEISTSDVGLAPKGTILSVVGRAFSDSPRSCCIERLRLAGGRGWISARLNGSFSGDRRVVELVGVDDR
jgi:hypothetical protein